jgi:hypothetical protein
MRLRNIFVLPLLFFLLIVSSMAMEETQSGEEQDLDNYGILRGKIIDEDTEKPVNEKFFVSINDPNYTLLSRFGTESDGNGFFKCKWKPGTYLLYFFPRSHTSKYCWDKNPRFFPGERNIITIEKGKITEIIKKATLAGRLKLLMVSTEGDKINPQIIFGGKIDCNARIQGESLIDNTSGEFFTEGDDFNDGEMLVHSLCPDKYTIEVTFDGMGIGSTLLKDIVIEKNSTTEVKVTIDLDDPTGVQGVIYFESGESIENVEVSIGGPIENSESISASVYTDQNGYYKIVGLKEGTYYVTFMKEIKDFVFLNISPRKVFVKNGSLSRLDVKIKNSK